MEESFLGLLGRHVLNIGDDLAGVAKRGFPGLKQKQTVFLDSRGGERRAIRQWPLRPNVEVFIDRHLERQSEVGSN